MMCTHTNVSIYMHLCACICAYAFQCGKRIKVSNISDSCTLSTRYDFLGMGHILPMVMSNPRLFDFTILLAQGTWLTAPMNQAIPTRFLPQPILLPQFGAIEARVQTSTTSQN